MADKISAAHSFVTDWVTENINPTGYTPEGDMTAAKQAAVECWAAADKAGISRAAIDEAVGDLVDYMEEQIEAVNDAEVARQIAKDKD